MTLIIAGTVRVPPENLEAFRPHMLAMMAASRAEDGCIDYDYAVDVFEPQPEALAALTRRVKESFDPKGILGPGRMYAGV